MASPGKRHCASCIGTLSFRVFIHSLMTPASHHCCHSDTCEFTLGPFIFY